MARQNPVSDLKRAVDEHFDAAVGTPVRAVVGAAELGGKVKDTVERGIKGIQDWWRGPRRRTTDIRLPNERRQPRGRRR